MWRKNYEGSQKWEHRKNSELYKINPQRWLKLDSKVSKT